MGVDRALQLLHLDCEVPALLGEFGDREQLQGLCRVRSEKCPRFLTCRFWAISSASGALARGSSSHLPAVFPSIPPTCQTIRTLGRRTAGVDRSTARGGPLRAGRPALLSAAHGTGGSTRAGAAAGAALAYFMKCSDEHPPGEDAGLCLRSVRCVPHTAGRLLFGRLGSHRHVVFVTALVVGQRGRREDEV